MALSNGVDVSHYQGTIDWPAVAAHLGPGGFAIVKLTEGANLPDDHGAQNIVGARKAGLRVGAYHFFRPLTSAAEQVAFFLRAYEPLRDEADLPPALDLEVPETGSLDVATPALEWLDVVELELGFAPTVYTGPSFALRHLSGKAGMRLATFPLWLAHYTDAAAPMACPPWAPGAWTIWQHSGRGRVPGIVGDVDLNRARGL